MKNRILRGATYIILALSIPAIGWGLKSDNDISNHPEIKKEISQSTVKEEKVISAASLFDQYISGIYTAAGLADASLDYAVFAKAITGYYNLKDAGRLSKEKQILSIVDFNKPSSEKRMWIIDLDAKKLLFNTLVAHGRGSGDNYATKFSNIPESNQSSLGFYVTANTYHGKHGLSLKINGMDQSYNSNALNRAVVIHGASYVSDDFVKQNGRLGRSLGCPALPEELTPQIISTIKNQTTLFIHGPVKVEYASDYLNLESALNKFISSDQQILAAGA
ncbi:L,D-transpeptidase-like protein [Arcticibacter pallidicorallinus]|uniref:L,D-transpeptidase-like protein n=1 Tax=Arcticibacter pallidicorallinus TaxID=1259464 RepID=A0A2T0U9Z3_9SPHI|nr:murein L,D-transpeptidase catalytic domain family protein [Arcticibacter pallidicorallinus]PRY54657.1 L,D-transpeptidase-like protein [Arcticibacter pallidicorallinus]